MQVDDDSIRREEDKGEPDRMEEHGDKLRADELEEDERMVDADTVQLPAEDAGQGPAIGPVEDADADAGADADVESGTQAVLAVPTEASEAASLADKNTSDDKVVTSTTHKPAKKKKAKSGSTATTTASKKKKVSIQTLKQEEAGSEREDSVLQDQDEVEEAEGEDDEDDKLYCICKAKFYDDEVRSMLACDCCDEWYHASCMNIDEEKVRFVDQFICCLCEPNTRLRTTMKQPCAREDCTGIAPFPLSKYCSQECGVLVAASRIAKIKQAKGVSLQKNAETLLQAPMLMSAKKTEGKVVWSSGIDKRRWLESIMGQRVTQSSGVEVAKLEAMQDLAEVEQLARLEKRKSQVEGKLNVVNLGLKVLEERAKLLLRVEDRAGTLELIRDEEGGGDNSRVSVKKGKGKKVKQEQVAEDAPKSQGQLRCGYDERLSWTNERFYTWSQTAEAQAMLDDVVERRIPLDGTLSVEGEEGSTDGIKICGQSKRKCKRHADWSLVRGQDMDTEKQLQDDLLASLDSELQELTRQIDEVKRAIHDNLAKQEEREREQDGLLARQLSLQGSRRSTVIHIP